MIHIEKLEPTPRFDKDLIGAPQDIQALARIALKSLLANPHMGKLRLHRLKGHHPALWKIDVLPNKSWQIAFVLNGEVAILKRLLTHKEADRL